MGQVIVPIALAILGAVVIAAACYGVYKIGKWYYSWIKCRLIRHEPGSSFVEIAPATNQQIANIQNNIQPENIPWKQIQITQDDIRILETLTKEQFWEQVGLYECGIAQGNQIMRKPVGWKCCAGKQLADKCNALRALQLNPNRCPLCGSSLSQNSMIQDGKVIKVIEKGIQTLRKRIRITFDSMNSELKAQFQSMVKECFGEEYTM